LDGLRGIAALFIVLFHLPASLQLWFSFPNAWIAVDFFFCLSGFVIAFSYEGRLLRGMRWRDFTVARLIRLYPLYILGTAFVLVSGLLFAKVYSNNHLTPYKLILSVLLAALFMPNLGGAWTNGCIFPLDGPAWSLFFDVFANLVYAGLVRLRLARSLLVGLIALICLAMLALYPGSLADVGTFTSTFGYGFARVGFSFCAGVLVFRIYERRPRPHWSGTRGILASVVLLIAFVAALSARGRIADQHATQLFLIAVVCPLLVYAGAYVEVSAVTGRLCSFFGDFSYPLYILHQPFLLVWGGRTAHRFAATHPNLTQISIPVFCCLVAGVAWMVGASYDSPIRRRLAQFYNNRHLRERPVNT
jgi:peptidoglycan/LPS O-acetylase OafA/YrhL